MAKELTNQDKLGVTHLLEKMADCDLFIGRYNAINGSEEFMYGILTVMDYITNQLNEDIADAYDNMFLSNMIESEDEARSSKIGEVLY